MALKNNVLANYLGQFYQILIGVLIIPFFLNYLGNEAYGLIAFFALLQSWFALLDLGMSPTLSREVANFFGSGSNEVKKFRNMISSLEFVFLILTFFIGLSVFLFADWLALNWVNTENLDNETVSFCIALMGIVAGFRFFTTLYRSAILGAEKQVWLNGANIVFLTLKNVGALLLFEFADTSIVLFFKYQVILGVIEFFVLGGKFYRLMNFKGLKLYFSYNILKPILPFAFGIAYTSGIWIALTQLDKLVLSKILSLSEYGYFALVALAANSILQITGPISKALLPRMTSLLAQGKEPEMLHLYRRATQFVTVILFSVAIVVCLYPYELLYAWTGNSDSSLWAKDILLWYVLGNTILGLASFQYYLQFAHGKLKLHVRYNTVFSLLTIPLIILTAFNYGAVGVAFFWFCMRLISFLLWTPYVHKKFAPKLHMKWILQDILPVFVSTVGIVFALQFFPLNFSLDRTSILIKLLSVGFIVLVINSLISKDCRQIVFLYGKKLKKYV